MRKLVDLTRTLEHGQTGVELETKYTVEGQGWNAKTLHLYSHAGTHLDAPFHFGVNDQTVEQIPLERLLVPGRIFDVSIQGPQQLIESASLGDQADLIQPGEAVLLRTNWSRHFGDSKLYRDALPRISRELANLLVEKQVGMLGVEPPSVADVNNLEEVTLIHQILLGGDIIIVEGLTNLNAIEEKAFWFGAMPLKIGGGDGTPCRAFAMMECDS